MRIMRSFVSLVSHNCDEFDSPIFNWTTAKGNNGQNIGEIDGRHDRSLNET